MYFQTKKVQKRKGYFVGAKKFVPVLGEHMAVIIVVFMFMNALNVIEGINIVITLEDILLSVQVR